MNILTYFANTYFPYIQILKCDIILSDMYNVYMKAWAFYSWILMYESNPNENFIK